MKTSVKKFFNEKTVLRPYLFEVSIPSSDDLTKYTDRVVDTFQINDKLYQSFKDYTNSFLSNFDITGSESLASYDLKPFSVKSVNVPNFSFRKEIVKVGPFSKSIPIMDFDGYELSIELSESEGLGIYRFINWLQSRQVYKAGWFWPEKLAAIPWIKIDVFKTHDSPQKVATITYEDLTFLQATEAQFVYSDSTPISYTLTFNANATGIEYFK